MILSQNGTVKKQRRKKLTTLMCNAKNLKKYHVHILKWLHVIIFTLLLLFTQGYWSKGVRAQNTRGL